MQDKNSDLANLLLLFRAPHHILKFNSEMNSRAVNQSQQSSRKRFKTKQSFKRHPWQFLIFRKYVDV